MISILYDTTTQSIVDHFMGEAGFSGLREGLVAIYLDVASIDDVTQEMIEGALPGPVTTISKLAFLARFSDAEKTYLMSTPAYQPLVLQVLAANEVDLADATSQYARQALAAAEVDGVRVFGEERLDEIFAVNT